MSVCSLGCGLAMSSTGVKGSPLSRIAQGRSLWPSMTMASAWILRASSVSLTTPRDLACWGSAVTGGARLQDVRRPRRRAVRRRVQRHRAAEAAVERQAGRVLLDVIDADALRPHAAVVLEHVEDHPRPLVLVFQVRGVDEDHLIDLH